MQISCQIYIVICPPTTVRLVEVLLEVATARSSGLPDRK